MQYFVSYVNLFWDLFEFLWKITYILQQKTTTKINMLLFTKLILRVIIKL